jgi:hypothetical protein
MGDCIHHTDNGCEQTKENMFYDAQKVFRSQCIEEMIHLFATIINNKKD